MLSETPDSNQATDPARLLDSEGFALIDLPLEPDALEYLKTFGNDSKGINSANQKKRIWMRDPAIRRIATDPGILALLKQIYGATGFYLWGAQIVDRPPGAAHHWHCDIETSAEGFVSLWIGITNSEKTRFAVVPGSHKLKSPLQAHFSWDDEARKDRLGIGIARKAEELGCPGRIESIRSPSGKAIVFDGRLWHGTFHEENSARRALLLQYGRVDAPVFNYARRNQFPFEVDRKNRPPVLQLSGRPDPVLNSTWLLRKDGQFGAPPAQTCAAPKLAARENQGFTRHPYFDTETPVLSHLSCHASILRGGCMPHLPHRHDDEELLIVLSGNAGILARHGQSREWRIKPARRGDVFYYPAGFRHTICNMATGTSAPPLLYLMFRWQARNNAHKAVESIRIPRERVFGEKRVMLDLPSSGLGKLHVHTSRLKPGQKFRRHIDQYCTGILVLDGQLSVLDKTLGPGGVFLTRAGELHDTRNTSDSPNHYLVFEFHDACNSGSSQR